MNVIAWDRAYSLYPRATFEKRHSLYLRADVDTEVIDKYKERGWEMLVPAMDHSWDPALFKLSDPRWIGDGRSWVLRLPTEGVTPPPPANERSLPMTRDPCAATAWCLVHDINHNVVSPVFTVVKWKNLEYKYVTYQRYIKDIKRQYREETYETATERLDPDVRRRRRL